MRKSTTLIATATLVAAAIGLSGCTGSTEQAGPDDEVTLSVAAFQGGGAELACIPELNEKFEKANPNITLDYKYVQEAQYDQYLNPRFASGDAPDVLGTNITRVQQWQKQGFLADLSDQPWAKEILPDIAAMTTIDGKHYNLPLQNIPIGLYANLDILNEAGISEVPQTWPDFVAALKTLKAAGKPGLLLANQTGWTTQQLANGLAVNVLDPSWGAEYDNGDSTWNPTWGPVFDQIRGLLTDGLVDGKLMNGVETFNTGNGEFAAGKWAFTIMGAWQLEAFSKEADFDFSLNPIPGGDTGSKPVGATFVGAGWGVNAASAHLDAAKKYLAFMAEPENDSCYLEVQNSFSTLSNVPSPEMPLASTFVEAFNDGRTHPAPIEYIWFPSYEPEFWKVGTRLFNDPSETNDALLSTLDTTIPKTPRN